MFFRKLPFGWLPKAAAGAVLAAAAAGIALLAWGVMSTSSDAVTTTGCSVEQSAGNPPPCAPGVAQTDAGTGAITAISAGGGRSCALKEGGVWCWGFKQGIEGSLVPLAVSGLTSGVSAISAGSYHTCALQHGGAWCWNSGLGGTPGAISLVPVAVSGLPSGVSAISTGSLHTCALKDGGVWCWDSAFGPPPVAPFAIARVDSVPVAVPGLTSGVTAISAGWGLSCALKDGGAWCWGSNWAGQLGNNSTTDSPVPVAVSGLTDGVSAISAGDAHVCALKDGGVWCWGWNDLGQLGNNAPSTTRVFGPRDVPAPSHVPVTVPGLGSGVSAISAGPAHTCALKDDGVWCWGDNSPVPVAVSGLAGGVDAISAGGGHTCALKDDGVWCWGANGGGQLGNNSTTDSPVPVAVLFTPPSASDIADTTGGKPLASQPSADSADRRATYVLAGAAAAALAIAAAGVWAVRRRRRRIT